MCPDDELLSAYHDGEVPEPWASRIRDHVASCPRCSATLSSFGALRAALTEDSESHRPLVDAARDRVWERLRAENADAVRVSKARAHGHPGWWRKSFVLSLPAAAAALLIALVGIPLATIALTGKRQALASAPVQAPFQDAALSDQGGAEPASFRDIQSLVQYLDSQDAPVRITVELPANRTYGMGGQPTLMKAQAVSTEASPR